MNVQMSDLSLLRVETVLRIEKSSWSIAKGKQQMSTPPPPLCPLRVLRVNLLRVCCGRPTTSKGVRGYFSAEGGDGGGAASGLGCGRSACRRVYYRGKTRVARVTVTGRRDSCCTRSELIYILYTWYVFIFIFFTHFYFAASGQAVATGVVPSPVRFLLFIAHRVQRSHCSSIFHRVLLTHALAFRKSILCTRKRSYEFIRVCTRGDSNSQN